MRDLSRMLNQWRKDNSNESRQHANNSLVSLFHPYVFPEDKETGNVDEEPELTSKQKKKNKKSQPVKYTFTDLTHQAHEMAVDLKDDSDFEPSTTLTLAFDKLRESRAKRDAALKVLDVKIPDAVSQSLYELGPPPQKDDRYQAQRTISLHRRMESFQVSKSNPRVCSAQDLVSFEIPASHIVDRQRSGIYRVSRPSSRVKGPSASNKSNSDRLPLPRGSPRDILHRQRSFPGPSIIKPAFLFSPQTPVRPQPYSNSNWKNSTPTTISADHDGAFTLVQSAKVST